MIAMIPQVKRMLQVGARNAAGIASIWHIDADDHEEANSQVHSHLTDIDKMPPLVVMTCILGGKS